LFYLLAPAQATRGVSFLIIVVAKTKGPAGTPGLFVKLEI